MEPVTLLQHRFPVKVISYNYDASPVSRQLLTNKSAYPIFILVICITVNPFPYASQGIECISLILMYYCRYLLK